MQHCSNEFTWLILDLCNGYMDAELYSFKQTLVYLLVVPFLVNGVTNLLSIVSVCMFVCMYMCVWTVRI